MSYYDQRFNYAASESDYDSADDDGFDVNLAVKGGYFTPADADTYSRYSAASRLPPVSRGGVKTAPYSYEDYDDDMEDDEDDDDEDEDEDEDED